MLNVLRKSKSANTIDATGIGLSALCVAHCLLLPTAAAAVPLLAPGIVELFGDTHEWHWTLLAIAAPVSLVGLGWGAYVTRSGWLTIVVGLAGLALMALGAMHLYGPVMETVLTLAGVTVLAGAHVANWRARARHGHVHDRDCGLCDAEQVET